MRRIIFKPRCVRDMSRMKRRGKQLSRLHNVVQLLATGGQLDIRFRPHKLTGEWEGYRECHIEPDWLLIYDITDTEILLARTGTHDDLFG